MKKKKKWYPVAIQGIDWQEFCDWINKGANFDNNVLCLDDKSTIGKDKKPNHITDFGRGYHQAVHDMFDKLGIDFR